MIIEILYGVGMALMLVWWRANVAPPTHNKWQHWVFASVCVVVWPLIVSGAVAAFAVDSWRGRRGA